VRAGGTVGRARAARWLVVRDEIARREDHLACLVEAKAVTEARAREREDAERAVYEETLARQSDSRWGTRPRSQRQVPVPRISTTLPTQEGSAQ